MIGWDVGLNVNVKRIDEEHQSLLNSITELSSAIDNNISNKNLIERFDSLEEELIAHFYYEEQLLRKCNYPDLEDHIIEHQEFMKIIPEIKEKLLNSKSYMNSKEVVLELTDALINNIIEDASSANYYDKCGITNNLKNNDSLNQKLITKTINTFSFSNRLILSTIVPLIGMIILGIAILYSNYTEYQNIKKVSSISLILSEVNKVTHNLQIERGLSCAVVTSKDDKFTKDLKLQYSKVNYSIKKLKDKLSSIDNQKPKNITKIINTIKSKVDLLESTRSKVKNREISVDDILKFYSNIINNTIKMNTKISILNHDKDISSSISALSSLLNFKESLGLQRAYGTIIVNKKYSNSKEYYNFIKLIGSKNTFIELFKNIATQTQINAFEKNITIL